MYALAGLTESEYSAPAFRVLAMFLYAEEQPSAAFILEGGRVLAETIKLRLLHEGTCLEASFALSNLLANSVSHAVARAAGLLEAALRTAREGQHQAKKEALTALCTYVLSEPDEPILRGCAEWLGLIVSAFEYNDYRLGELALLSIGTIFEVQVDEDEKDRIRSTLE